MATVEEVLDISQRNNRICPQPQKWNELYGLLPDKRRNSKSWEPPLPLILATWWDTPSLAKAMRLQEHINWAAQKGCLDIIYSFLKNLKEEEWYHLGE